MSKKPMTIEQAIELLRQKYDEAKNLKYVINPLAWALYQVWKEADNGKS